MRTLSAAATSVASVCRTILIVIAAVLVTGSIATSLARPSPRAYTPGGGNAAVEGASVGADKPTEAPSPAPEEDAREASLWRSTTNTWSKASEIPPGELSINDAVPSLVRADGLRPGGSYLIRLQYGACNGTAGRPFERLASARAAAGTPLLSAPGPGRERPDSTIPIPPEYASAASAEVPYFALWGGTFSGPAVSGRGSDACPDASTIELWVHASSDTLVLAFAGEFASAAWADSGGILAPLAYVSTFP